MWKTFICLNKSMNYLTNYFCCSLYNFFDFLYHYLRCLLRCACVCRMVNNPTTNLLDVAPMWMTQKNWVEKKDAEDEMNKELWRRLRMRRKTTEQEGEKKEKDGKRKRENGKKRRRSKEKRKRRRSKEERKKSWKEGDKKRRKKNKDKEKRRKRDEDRKRRKKKLEN